MMVSFTYVDGYLNDAQQIVLLLLPIGDILTVVGIFFKFVVSVFFFPIDSSFFIDFLCEDFLCAALHEKKTPLKLIQCQGRRLFGFTST